MSFQQINWIAGEAIDGSVGMPGIFTSSLKNIFLNDQKHPIIRAANNFHSTYVSPVQTKYVRSVDSMTRGWVCSATLASDTTCNILVFDNANLLYSQTLTSTKKIKSIFFNEVNEDTFTAISGTTRINPVVGATAILICGLDKTYYIDSDFIKEVPVIKEFKIATSIETTGVTVVDSVDSTTYQSRLALVCASPHLTAKLPNYSTKRVLLSRTYSMDDYTIKVPGTGVDDTDLAQNPIDIIILGQANEEFYSITTDENLLILVTSLGLRIIKSGDEMSTYAKNSNVIQYIGGYGSTVRARAIPFAGFLIYATTYTLRAKMLQSLETDYVNTIDLMLPLLSDFSSKIRDLSMDYNTQNLLVFLENGNVSSIAAQSIIPSNSYNLTLPVTSSYVSENIEFLFVSSMNPSWMILRNYDDAGVEYYSICSRDHDSNYYGFLLDGATPFLWKVTPTNITENSFTASFSSRFLSTTGIIGVWVQHGTTWRYYSTDPSNYPTFTTETTGHTLTDGSQYDCVVVSSENGYQTLPHAFCQKWTVAEVNINITGDNDGENYQFFEFHDAPIVDFCSVNNIPTNQTYQGEIKVLLALGSPEMSIGWRDVNCIDNLYNRGGIRCVLLSDSNDLLDYVEFYNENASVGLQINADCTEIDFQTNVGASYVEKSINATSKKFKSSLRDKRFTRLIGQY